MNSYTEHELTMLYHKLRPENGHWAQMIKRKILMILAIHKPEQYMERLHYPQLIEPHIMPYEQLPLHINDSERYKQCVVQWRLEIGR